jgi:membrane protein DedA with SNARE-associated domain
MADLPAFAQSLVSCGLAGAFLVASIEKLLPVIPSIGLYLILGILSDGRPAAFLALILVTAMGSTIGSLCWFGIARAAGTYGWHERRHRLLERYARSARPVIGLAGTTVAGVIAVQLLPVARAYTGLLYGSSSVGVTRFALSTFAGCCVWNGVLTSVGRIIGTL